MRVSMARAWAAFTVCAAAWPGDARATPTTTYGAPSTTGVQAFPHLAYDTYFARGPTAGQPGSPLYPIDTGLTLGVLFRRSPSLAVGAAGGAGASFCFDDATDVLTGPVWFFDAALQPGGRDLLWTVQLDVDVPWLRR